MDADGLLVMATGDRVDEVLSGLAGDPRGEFSAVAVEGAGLEGVAAGVTAPFFTIWAPWILVESSRISTNARSNLRRRIGLEIHVIRRLFSLAGLNPGTSQIALMLLLAVLLFSRRREMDWLSVGRLRPPPSGEVDDPEEAGS